MLEAFLSCCIPENKDIYFSDYPNVSIITARYLRGPDNRNVRIIKIQVFYTKRVKF